MSLIRAKDPSRLVSTSRVRTVLLLTLVILGAVSGESIAQTSSEVNSGVQVDFPLPGARSLAMGGAFVAIADDASAAVANPAGLTALIRPEISVEGRAWQFISVTPLRGHGFGPPTGAGVDTISGIVDGDSTQRAGGPSFLSAVFPVGRFALGIYRQDQSRFRSDIVSEGPFLTNGDQPNDRLPPFTGTMKLDIVNYGVSVAKRFAGGLAIGGGVALADFAIDSVVGIFNYSPDLGSIQPAARTNFTGVGQAFGPANFADSNRVGDIVENGKDKGVAVNFGALFRPAGRNWSAGGAVRINPEFQYDEYSVWGPAQPDPALRGTFIVPPIVVAFKVPDVYSVGGAFRATERFLISVQYDRVQFSQLSRNLQDVNGTNGGEAHLAIIQGLKNPDSNQLRAGTEYASVHGNRVLSLRLGTAYESAHRMFFTPTTPTRFTRLEALFRPDTGQWHATPGVGVAFPKFQLDAGVDVSHRTRTLSVSAVYRF